MASTAVCNNTVNHIEEEEEIVRPISNFSPSLWGDRFLSFSIENLNDMLLRFAKLDYNMFQMLHKQELAEVSRWWKDLNFVNTLPYARDRVVECYFWALGVYYEPQYSQARVMLVMTIAMISIVDDTYNAYGTVEELSIYTDFIQRWDIKEIGRLLDYMKISYKALLDLYDDYEKEMSSDGRSHVVYYAKERLKELVRSYNIEAKWFIEGHAPPAFEYLRNAFVTTTYYYLATTSYLGIKYAKEQEFEWLSKNPKILEGCVTICRVIDDIATYEVEKDRGQLSTVIECYMRDYSVSTKDAMAKFQEMVRAQSSRSQGYQQDKPNNMAKSFFLTQTPSGQGDKTLMKGSQAFKFRDARHGQDLSSGRDKLGIRA
ncbi:5-epi-aristolochene synthase 3 [Capsicum chinense]|nr:5-epi-aristolochene synthase 3 [Capsicum chinense]